MYKIVFLDATKSYKFIDSMNFQSLVNLKLNLERTGNQILCIFNSSKTIIHKGLTYETHFDKISNLIS
jgi:hypothetical protein